jgi:hypothetical protein
VLVVAPAALRHREIPQPHGRVLYNLVTGHPDRAPHDLVFLADLTVELRAWPQQTWTTVGVNPEAALLAVVDRWRAGRVKGLELGGVSAEEARALGRPPMGYRGSSNGVTTTPWRSPCGARDRLWSGLSPR